MGLAVGLHYYRRARAALARALDSILRKPRSHRASIANGAVVHPQRRTGRDHVGALDAVAPLSADVGILGWEAARRSHLVVLSILAAEVSRREVRDQARRPRGATDSRVPDRGRRLHRWRLAFELAHQARLERESRAQDGHARHGATHRSD